MDSTGDADGREQQITATIVRYEDACNECTLHPVDPEERERTTAWISAEGESYLPLLSCR